MPLSHTQNRFYLTLNFLTVAVSAVATLRNLVDGTESTSYGGVIFARARDDTIHHVHDVRDKVVVASSIYDMDSGPMQWEEMRAVGEDLLFAPSQVTDPHGSSPLPRTSASPLYSR